MIKNKKVKFGKNFYLVKWKDYDKSTWEPESNLTNSKAILNKYERNNQKGIIKRDKKVKKKEAFKVINKDQGEKKSLKREQEEKHINKKEHLGINIKKKENEEKNINIKYQEGNFSVEKGSFDTDHPSKIITSRITGNNEIFCLVEWMPRTNGFTYDPTYYSAETIKDKDMNLLADYYESIVKLPPFPDFRNNL